MLITCTYRGQEFIRVGYYVNNEYTETELRENPPVKPDFSKVRRVLLFYQRYYRKMFLRNKTELPSDSVKCLEQGIK